MRAWPDARVRGLTGQPAAICVACVDVVAATRRVPDDSTGSPGKTRIERRGFHPVTERTRLGPFVIQGSSWRLTLRRVLHLNMGRNSEGHERLAGASLSAPRPPRAADHSGRRPRNIDGRLAYLGPGSHRSRCGPPCPRQGPAVLRRKPTQSPRDADVCRSRQPQSGRAPGRSRRLLPSAPGCPR